MALLGIPAWVDQDIVLYHGTIDVYIPDILSAVKYAAGAILQDFGRGFYTTTNLDKAILWAEKRANQQGGTPAVIEFSVSRNDLAGLDGLWFIRSDRNAQDFWSFVQYCRTISSDHNRHHTAWSDYVAGPVSGSWKKQTVIPETDQVSFHTPAGTTVLDHSRKVRIL